MITRIYELANIDFLLNILPELLRLSSLAVLRDYAVSAIPLESFSYSATGQRPIWKLYLCGQLDKLVKDCRLVMRNNCAITPPQLLESCTAAY